MRYQNNTNQPGMEKASLLCLQNPLRMNNEHNFSIRIKIANDLHLFFKIILLNLVHTIVHTFDKYVSARESCTY